MIGLDNYFFTMKKNFLLFYSVIAVLFALPTATHAAVLYSQSVQQSVAVGEIVTINQVLDTQGQAINVIDSVISYDPALFEYAGSDTGTSVLLFWPTTPTIETPGRIHFVGALPAGIAGDTLPIITMRFRARAIGQGAVIATNTLLLAADGAGTSVIPSVQGVTVPIVSTQETQYRITSRTHPEQSLWYKDSTAVLQFPVVKGESYSYSFSRNVEIVPDQIPETTDGTVRYQNMPDGTYYFRLAVKSGAGQWQEAGMYQVHIDRTVPQFLAATVEQSYDEQENNVLSVAALDKSSGVASYKARSGWFGFYRTVTPPSIAKRPLVGSFVTVKVTDVAGNKKTITVPYRAHIPTAVFIIIVLSLCAIIGYTIHRNWKKLCDAFFL